MTKKVQENKIRVRVDRELFYSSNTQFGVYAFSVIDSEKPIELNKYGNLTVSGNSPQMEINEVYDIVIAPTESKKYGKGWGFVNVMPPRPETVEEQQEYFKNVLTEKQYEAFIEAYPNHKLLDMMENDEFDVDKLKGIKEATLAKLKVKLLGDLVVNILINELKELGVTFTSGKALLNHFGSVQAVLQAVENNIYELCRVKNFGFKKVDAYALSRGDSKDSEYRILAGIEYMLNQERDKGHTWSYVNDMYPKFLELLEISDEVLSKVIEDIKADNLSSPTYSIKGSRIFFDYSRDTEKRIAQLLVHKLHQDNALQGDLTDEEFNEYIEDRIDKVEHSQAIKYSEGQRNAIRLAMKNNVLVINGLAGSGKSTVVKGIIDTLNINYMACALSGNATKVLQQEDISASTIHRMLGAGIKEDGEFGFTFNEDNKLSYQMIIVDESSMTNIHLFRNILESTLDDTKIIFVGDIGQLPSIGEGQLFADLIESEIIPRQELTEIHRQAKDSGIVQIAHEVRAGNHINSEYGFNTLTYGEKKDMSYIPRRDGESIMDVVVAIAKKNKGVNLHDFQVLGAVRERGDISIRNLNIALQQVFNDINKPFIKSRGYEYREGDKIIQVGNNYGAETESGKETDVFNGSLGIIKSIVGDTIIIDFVDNEEDIVYHKDDLEMVEMGYAITTHKSQGSGIKRVLFAFDFSAYTLLSREFVYTGITRASEACIVVANNSAMRMAIQKSVGKNRRTFLPSFIKEFSNAYKTNTGK